MVPITFSWLLSHIWLSSLRIWNEMSNSKSNYLCKENLKKLYMPCIILITSVTKLIPTWNFSIESQFHKSFPCKWLNFVFSSAELSEYRKGRLTYYQKRLQKVRDFGLYGFQWIIMNKDKEYVQHIKNIDNKVKQNQKLKVKP